MGPKRTTWRHIVGMGLIAAPFMGIAGLCIHSLGPMRTLMLFAGVGAVMGLIKIGVDLIHS